MALSIECPVDVIKKHHLSLAEAVHYLCRARFSLGSGKEAVRKLPK
jgi:hypothetical protein